MELFIYFQANKTKYFIASNFMERFLKITTLLSKTCIDRHETDKYAYRDSENDCESISVRNNESI